MEQFSQRRRIMEYIQSRYAAEPEYLWAKYPNYAVFRQPASRKWFAAIMDVNRKSLDLPGAGTADVMDLKCGAVLVGSLLAQDGFRPAYHMSKQFPMNRFSRWWSSVMTAWRRSGKSHRRCRGGPEKRTAPLTA